MDAHSIFTVSDICFIYIYYFSTSTFFFSSFDDSFFRLESNKLLWFVLYMDIALYGFLIWQKTKIRFRVCKEAKDKKDYIGELGKG